MGLQQLSGDRRNPKNRSVYDLDFAPVRRVTTKNGAFFAEYSRTLHRHLELDIFSGWLLNDFNKRKSSGELLPYTAYINCLHNMRSTSGSTLEWSHRDNPTGNVFVHTYSWADGSPLPLQDGVSLSTAKLNEVDVLLSELGLDPFTEVQKAVSILYSRGWDGLTFAAELHKVVSMFRNAVPKLVNLILEYVTFRKRNRAATRTVQSFSQWLEGRYGWRVLIYDIKDMNEVIRSIGKDQLNRVKERSGLSTTHLVSSTVGPTEASSFRRYYADVTSYEVGVRGSIITDFMPSKVLVNPVVTAWELVPFSFVVDWFFTIGHALNAISFMFLNTPYTAAASHYVKATREFNFSHVNFAVANSTLLYHNFDTVNVTEEWEVRERRPVRVPYLPRIKINLNGFKVLDLLAILTNAILKLSRR